ncbi:helix-turn-helix transcriptional regulator [Nonomuraea sp. NPDC049129]|uniref:helix-turn-helix transcriptional regulator n=1 Tax=Nonomuraea sp. NPDC049129 TaxID=3155272 RepID=UPI0033D0A964
MTHPCGTYAASQPLSGHVPYAALDGTTRGRRCAVAGKRRRLADRRKALGYSQEYFADQLGIDRTTAGRWELGKTEPCPYIRPKICDLLKVTADELDHLLVLCEEPEKPSRLHLDTGRHRPGRD